MDFRPTLISPPSWIFLSKIQRNRVQRRTESILATIGTTLFIKQTKSFFFWNTVKIAFSEVKFSFLSMVDGKNHIGRHFDFF
jgi:hypothetical protein